MSAPESSLPVAGTVVVLRAADPGFELLLMRRPDRGSFAGAWSLPGGKVEPGDVRDGDDEAEDARRAAIRETREEVGLAVDDLVPLSQWQPPLEAPTRIRTWFFLAEAPDEEPSPSAEEVAEIAWVRPAEALVRHAAGVDAVSPTWITLHQLSVFGDVAAAVAASGVAQLFRTRVLDSDAGRAFTWDQGRLEAGALPWRFIET